jgi:ubiquinone/menaquinone biosynthesis C-methylase UbiE
VEAKDAWSLPGVIDFYGTQRQTTKHVYESEFYFLRRLLREGMSILDIGCAQGGFANILGEHLKTFSYTGVDISEAMITEAKKKYPQHQFFTSIETRLPEQLPNFDVVICLGILHLNSNWRSVVAQAWQKTNGALLLDLRETEGETIEDISKSYFKMNFNGQENEARIPYNIINSCEARNELRSICSGHTQLRHYGYLSNVSASAVTPNSKVMMNTYLVER